MRTRLIYVFAFLLMLTSAYAFDVESFDRTAFVNDQADVMEPVTEQRITEMLRRFEQNTTIEFAVVTTRSLEGGDIFDASFRAAEYLGVGKQDVDNGLLVFVAVEDRRWFIQVGYGLEGIIPDAVAKQVGEELLVPAFRQGAYGQGIEQTLQQLIEIASADPSTRSEYHSTYLARAEAAEGSPADWLQIIFAVVFIIILVSGRFGIWPIFFMGGFGGRGGSGRFGSGGFGGGSFGGFGGGGFGGGGAGGGW
ncbi:MAG: TPM domain-containing protein [Nanoarchaeota archaeon]